MLTDRTFGERPRASALVNIPRSETPRHVSFVRHKLAARFAAQADAVHIFTIARAATPRRAGVDIKERFTALRAALRTMQNEPEAASSYLHTRRWRQRRRVPHLRTSLHSGRSLFLGKVVFAGGDKTARAATIADSAETRDERRLRMPANPGLFTPSQEIFTWRGVIGGAERTRTACQARSRHRTGLSRVIPPRQFCDATTLSRKDWHSGAIGAVLSVNFGRQGRSEILPRRLHRPGGASVVRR
jgi:hypothetical protein